MQTKDKINLAASRGVALGELFFATGEPDYTLFADGKAIGTTEANPEGMTLASVEKQSAKDMAGVPFGLPAWKSPLPFCYESTGAETFFTNRLDPDPRSHRVFLFHRPETLLAWPSLLALVEQRLSVREELETVVSANLQRVSSLCQSILQRAFTGELV